MSRKSFFEERDEQSSGIVNRDVVGVARSVERHLARGKDHVFIQGPVEVYASARSIRSGFGPVAERDIGGGRRQRQCARFARFSAGFQGNLQRVIVYGKRGN